MKAKVIATGEIANVRYSRFDYDKCLAIYKEIGHIRTWSVDELELYIPEGKQIDWEQRRFELVKVALGGALANSELLKSFKMVMDKDVSVHTPFVNFAFSTADAVIAKLKEE